MEAGEEGTTPAAEPLIGSGVLRAARPPSGSGIERDVGLRAAIAAALGDAEVTGAPRIGRFVLDRKLGQGGMGVVYRARDPELDRVVALKFLHAREHEGERERLLKEARTLARLSDPGVVAIYEVGVHQERVYFAMEYVEGGNLRQWLDGHPEADWRTVLDLFVQAGRGLVAAHGAGIVHRDFKPQNVLVGDDGRVRVGDFGLATMGSTTAVSDTAVRTDSESDSRDPTSVVGTPAYMAPEQLAGRAIGPRSDQYGFCKSLRECLDLVAEGPARSRPRWARRLHRVLERGLQEDPERRHPDMRALIGALERFRTRRRTAMISGAFVIGAAALVLASRMGAEPSGVDPGEACRRGGRALPEALGEPPLRALEDAFRPQALGPETFAVIRPRLEEYARQWEDAYVNACDATWRVGAQSSVALDLRLDCLKGRRVHFETLLTTLASGSEAIVEVAPIAVAELPSLDACEHPEQLARVAPPPEVGPEVVAEVSAIALEVARIEAEITLSPGPHNVDRALRIVERAVATEHAPIIARAHLLHGLALEHDDRSFHGAAQRAFVAAQRGFDDRAAFTAALDLSSLSLDERNDLAEATFWADTAAALAQRLQLGPHAHGEVELARGHVALSSMKAQEAAEAFQRALELFDAEQPSLQRANTLAALGIAFDSAGRFDDALAMHERALDDLVALLGPRHPVVLDERGNLATALLGAGRLDEARVAYEDLLAAHAERGGEARSGIPARLNLGEVERLAGRYAEAERHVRTVIEQLEGRDDEGGHLATAHHNLAAILEMRGRYDEGLEVARAGVELVRRSNADQPQLVARARVNEAVMLWRLGRDDEARELLDSVISTLVEELGGEHIDLIPVYELRAAVELDAGRPARAVEDAKRGLVVLGSQPTDDPIARARLELRRGEAELGLGRYEGAREALEAARMDLSDDELADAWARFLLARVSWAEAEEASALAEAQAARGVLANASSPHDRKWLEACEAWLRSHAGG